MKQINYISQLIQEIKGKAKEENRLEMVRYCLSTDSFTVLMVYMIMVLMWLVPHYSFLLLGIWIHPILSIPVNYFFANNYVSYNLGKEQSLIVKLIVAIILSISYHRFVSLSIYYGCVTWLLN